MNAAPSTTEVSEATSPAAPETLTEEAGQTAVNLLATFWGEDANDLYVSRSMQIRLMSRGPGWGDAIWITEPPEPPVCFFRVTPARMLGLALRLKDWRQKLTAALAETELTADEKARVELLKAAVARDAAALKLLKAEVVIRYPKEMQNLGLIAPEDLVDVARPSDAWVQKREVEQKPLVERVTIWTEGEALAAAALHLASQSPPPSAPCNYATVLDTANWLRKLARQAQSGGAAAPPAIARLTKAVSDLPPATESAVAVATAKKTLYGW
jgi:hypothetical protein